MSVMPASRLNFQGVLAMKRGNLTDAVYLTEESSDKKILHTLNEILQHPDRYTQKVATSVDYDVDDVKISIAPTLDGIQVYFHSWELQRAGGTSGGGVASYLYLTENTVSSSLRPILDEVSKGFIQTLGMPDPEENKKVPDRMFNVWKQVTERFNKPSKKNP